MDLHEELARLVDAIEAAGVEYALCGGLALAVHGFPRFTKDIDLLVLKDDVESVVEVARDRGFTVDAGRIPFGVGGPRVREVRRVSKFEGPEILTLDLVILPPWLEEVWRTRERFEWEGRRLAVVSRDGLAEMKRIAGRAQDLADLERLEGGEDVEASP